MINPYEKAVQSELLRIINATNSQLIPRDVGQLQTLLDTLGDVLKASRELSRLFTDLSEVRERAERESKRRRNESNTSSTSSQFTALPKLVIERLPRLMDEQRLREIRFSHESTKAIISHRNKHLKNILHKHRVVYGDTTKLMKLLEKYEVSQSVM